MDPISAIFVMTVLGGLFVKGVDVATDGLLSAEVGAGVRGAGRFAVRDVRDRWAQANEKAREVRSRTRSGRVVQGILDDAGAAARTGWLVTRVLFGEARRFGSGARSEWQTARDQARSARTGRRGDAPWPIVRAARSGRVRAQEWAERRAPAVIRVPDDPDANGAERGSFAAADDPRWYRVTIASKQFGWASVRVDYLGNRTDVPQLLTTFDEGYGVSGAVREATDCVADETARHGGAYRIEWVINGGEPTTDMPVTPYGAAPGESDEFGPLPMKCPDCGMALVIGSLNDHRMGRDRCHYADMDDDPNGDPNVPLESTVPDANGDVRCGCCAQLHKPLPPGEHCPDCHIHDHPSQIPNGTTPNAPTTKGPNVTDINSAPAAITAWDAFGDRWESLQSRADALHAEQDALTNEVHGLFVDVATLADSMGDFAIGRETDTSAAVGELADTATSAREQAVNLTTSITSAKESVDSYVDALRDDLNPGIEAAAGKVADVHAVMQES